MADIYITGHKNPDMDSVCSAHCYALLKNKIDPHNNYIAIRCGHMNNQTKMVFQKVQVKAPRLLKDIRPLVADVSKRDIATLDYNEPVLSAIKQLDEENISLIPVFKDESEFMGTVSLHEISGFLINGNSGDRPVYRFRTANFKQVLPGYFYKRGGENEFDAPIMTGAMPFEISKERISQMQPLKPILVIGLREDILHEAIKQQFPAIILTGIQDDESIPMDFSQYHGTLYVSHADTAETIRLLRLSTPIKNVANTTPIRIETTDSFDKAKDILVSSALRGLPVFEGNNFSGIITRRCFIEKPIKKLIMMDHNETEQSIPGAEQAEILEILDHHRLGNSRTKEPIYVYAKPIGSTCSIVYMHYKLNDIDIDPETATLMVSGILSDTVLLQSPTTTDMDRDIVNNLLEIAGLDLMEYGKEILSQNISLEKEDPLKVCSSDFKIYREDAAIGISQVEVGELENVPKIKKAYLKALEELKRINKLDWVLMLITNVITGQSDLLCTYYPEGESLLVYAQIEENLYDLPGILSRKKQLLPEILRVLEDAKNSGPV